MCCNSAKVLRSNCHNPKLYEKKMSKTSFVLHLDSLSILDKLSKEQAGEFILAIRNYKLTGEIPSEFWLQLALEPFVNQFKRDDAKCEDFSKKQRDKGLKSAESRRNKKQPPPTAVNHGQPSPTNSTYNGSDSVSDNGSVNESVSKKKSSPSEIEISDDGKKFANWFNDKMKPESIKPSEADIKAWGKIYDDLIRLDKKEKKEITDAVIWARTDDFWKNTFLSPLKLRKKDPQGIKYIDVFIEKMNAQTAKKEQPKKNIDPQFGYDTSKPGEGKEYNAVIGKFIYRNDYQGERV